MLYAEKLDRLTKIRKQISMLKIIKSPSPTLIDKAMISVLEDMSHILPALHDVDDTVDNVFRPIVISPVNAAIQQVVEVPEHKDSYDEYMNDVIPPSPLG